MLLEDYLKGRGPLRSIDRFHMEYVVKRQNIAEHGYHVGTLFYLICQEMKLDLTAEDVMLVMNHDFIETRTGDLNLCIKEFSEDTKKSWEYIEKATTPSHLLEFTDRGLIEKLGPIKAGVFLFTDALEAYLYCLEELNLGNKMLNKALNHYRTKVYNLCPVVLSDIVTKSLHDFIGGTL